MRGCAGVLWGPRSEPGESAFHFPLGGWTKVEHWAWEHLVTSAELSTSLTHFLIWKRDHTILSSECCGEQRKQHRFLA